MGFAIRRFTYGGTDWTGLRPSRREFCSSEKGRDKSWENKGWKGLASVEYRRNKKGLPVALLVEDANPHEINFAQKIVEKIRIPQRRGAPIKKPKILVADKGYNSQVFRNYLQKKGIMVRIPLKKNQKPKRGTKPKDFGTAYKQRFKVERCFAWMDNFRRLVVRYDRSALMYRGFCVLACIIMCLRYF
jgi:transposase